MRIGVEGEPSAVVAQHTGQGFHIHATGEGHGGESVAQIMEANMLLNTGLRQQFPVNPGHRVRAPVAAGAGRREQDGAVRMLFMLLHQQGHSLLGQRHLSDGILGFRLRHHQLPVDAGDLLAHREDTVLHIQVIPPERQQLPTPQAAGQFQEEHGQHAVLLRLTEIYPQLLWRNDGHLLFLLGRDAAVVTRVVGNDPLFDRLLQRRGEHHVDAPHCASRQGRVGLFLEPLHPPFGLGIVVHLLDLDGGEPFEFYSSDGRYDVVFDHVLIGLCGVGADHRLAIGFKPQPAPLR